MKGIQSAGTELWLSFTQTGIIRLKLASRGVFRIGLKSRGEQGRTQRSCLPLPHDIHQSARCCFQEHHRFKSKTCCISYYSKSSKGFQRTLYTTLSRAQPCVSRNRRRQECLCDRSHWKRKGFCRLNFNFSSFEFLTEPLLICRSLPSSYSHVRMSHVRIIIVPFAY